LEACKTQASFQKFAAQGVRGSSNSAEIKRLQGRDGPRDSSKIFSLNENPKGK
jgi:hypothetical protein